MIKLLKNIFGRAVGSSNGSRRAQQPVLPVAAPVAPKHQGNAKSKHAPPHGTKSSATAAPQQKPGEPDGDLNLPLTAVLNGLPPRLKSRVGQMDVRGATLAVSLRRVNAQLPTGSVKISFGELRQAAPQLFAEGTDCDNVDIELPMEEILSRVNSTAMGRRPDQKRVEVPASTQKPFGDRKQAAPAGRNTTPAPADKSFTPAAPIRVPLTPAALRPETNGGSTMPAPATSRSVAPKVQAVVAGGQASTAVHSNGKKADPQPATHDPMPAMVTNPVPNGEVITVAFADLMEDWPETVRSEIKRANLNNAQIALPVGLIEPALKKGKAVFSWKAIRGWISSAPVPTSSSQDSLMLELPLEFLMPVFMARHGSEKPKRRISVDESIPNLFAGVAPETEAPKAAAGSATKTESLQTNRLAKKAEPQKPAAPTTPNEIVTRAAALDKVAGALIALSDGLLVASRLPSDAKGDTLAAFVPQMFAKMNACIETLSLGELQDLNFTAGNVPWRIYRLDRVFFAVFGRAGQTLPGDELAALAVQLRKGSS